jgi:hypothetical protein
MNHRLGRIAALVGTGAMALAIVGPVAAASPAKLTAVVAVDSTDAPAAGQAWIRVLHGSPDAPAVDVYVDGTKAITALAFGDITDYTPVPAGDHAIKVCATGSTTVCPIDVPTLNLADGKKYTIAATDLLANIQAQVLEDAPAVNADQAQVRVVHFSADTPAVDVLAQDGSDVNPALDDLTYPNATAYLALPAGSYDLKVCAHADHTVCPLDPPALTLDAGKAYSVFAVGSLDATLATPAPSATAAPSVTPPPTDTAAATGTTDTNGPLVAALVLLGLFALGSVVTLRFAARRVER